MENVATPLFPVNSLIPEAWPPTVHVVDDSLEYRSSMELFLVEDEGIVSLPKVPEY